MPSQSLVARTALFLFEDSLLCQVKWLASLVLVGRDSVEPTNPIRFGLSQDCNPFSQKLDRRTVKLVKRRSEMIEDIAREQRFFTGAFEKNRDFRGSPA